MQWQKYGALANSVIIMKLLTILPLVFLLFVTACGNNDPELITKRQLRTLMIDSLSHSAESWWYVGSDNGAHFISIERAGNSRLYTIPSEGVRLKVDRFEFRGIKGKRVNLKLNKIKVVK